MSTTINPLKEKIASNEPILGLWSIIPSPPLIELFACAGFDFVILDMEHGAFGYETLDNCIRACDAAGTAAIVRPPGANLFAIQKSLDLGAHGILVPQMANTKACVDAIRMTKYAPDGCRGFNPFTRAANYSPPASIPSGKLDNNFGLSGVIIETTGAYEELSQILAIPGLDWIYLGAYDMSVSLGCAGNTKDRRVLDFLETATRLAVCAGKTTGLMVRNEEEVKQALAMGARSLIYAVDTYLIHCAASEVVVTVQKAKEGFNA